MAEEKNSQTVDPPAAPAPLEADIDSLLGTIPQLKDVFPEGSPETPAAPAQPEQKTKEGVPKPEPETPAVDSSALDELIPEGLKPETEKPPETKEEPRKEEFSEKVQARIDELTAKRKSAEERATALETELTELKSKFQAPPVLAPSPANPLSDVMTMADLEKRKADIEQAKNWCIQHLDGGEVADKDGNKRFLGAQEVKEIFANAEMLLSKHIGDRHQYLTNKALFDKEATREYPALFKAGTEANKTYLQWLTVFPECQKYPDIALIIGDALVGQQIRFDRAKKRGGRNGTLPPQNQTPLATPAPAASPRVPQSKTLSGEALRTAMEANPEQALDAFVGGLIDDAAARRTR